MYTIPNAGLYLDSNGKDRGVLKVKISVQIPTNLSSKAKQTLDNIKEDLSHQSSQSKNIKDQFLSWLFKSK